MERIEVQGVLLAVVVRKYEFNSGYNFISENEWLLQVGFNSYSAGQVCPPHEHLMKPISIEKSEVSLELLYLIRGEAEVDVFWQDQFVKGTLLTEGDAIFLIRGGHALRMEKSTKILEVKQGPYYSKETDKRIFHPKTKVLPKETQAQ